MELKKMELIYSALLLHATKQPVNEENVSKVLTAAGAPAEVAKVKALVAALDGVNIDEAIAKAAMPVAVAAAPAAQAEKKEEKKEEDTAKKAEEAAAGLGALFG